MSSQLEIVRGISPEVGFTTWQVLGTSPTPTSKSKKVAGCIKGSDACSNILFISLSVSLNQSDTQYCPTSICGHCYCDGICMHKVLCIKHNLSFKCGILLIGTHLTWM